MTFERMRATVFWYQALGKSRQSPSAIMLAATFPYASKCICYRSSTASILPCPLLSLRTRRSLFIPGFIVRLTSPSRRLRLSTKRRRRIPTELWRRCPSYRRRRTASIPIAWVCRRRRRCRKIFPGCRRIIRS